MALLCSQLGLVLELICWQRKDKEKELSWRSQSSQDFVLAIRYAFPSLPSAVLPLQSWLARWLLAGCTSLIAGHTRLKKKSQSVDISGPGCNPVAAEAQTPQPTISSLATKTATSEEEQNNTANTQRRNPRRSELKRYYTIELCLFCFHFTLGVSAQSFAVVNGFPKRDEQELGDVGMALLDRQPLRLLLPLSTFYYRHTADDRYFYSKSSVDTVGNQAES
ncbi:hypothetical protein Q9233_014465 [Columba guinea]|nr:hypothetical protein Q9233_014465 [Columba guinea]